MTRPRIGVRWRLLMTIVVAVALALMVAVTAFSYFLGQRLDASATSLARSQAEAAVSAVQVSSGTLVAPEWPDENPEHTQVWIFDGSGVLDAPSASEDVDAAARSLADGPEGSIDVGQATRLFALPIVREGERQGTVVAAVSLDPYAETARTALVGSLILAAAVLGSVALVSWWMLGRALRPVSRMTEDAAAWGDNDLDRRFDLGEPYDELTRLAATLDNLLERIAASLRHEQRLTAELSHELRTPLARIHGRAELMLRRDRTADEYRTALAGILDNAAQMTRIIEALVSAARQEAGLVMATSDLRDAVQAAVTARDADTGTEFRVTLPSQPIRVAIDEELAERMIQPLIDNAARYGRTFVDVSLALDGQVASVHIVDDGPGLAAGEQSTVFEPGTRGSAATHSGEGGAGLGLSLARRLARSAGGDISSEHATPGARFTLTLPVVK